MDYKIITGKREQVEREVTALLEQGWQLSGFAASGNNLLNQSLVRERVEVAEPVVTKKRSKKRSKRG